MKLFLRKRFLFPLPPLLSSSCVLWVSVSVLVFPQCKHSGVVRGKDPKPHPEGSAKIYLDETECEIIFEDKYNKSCVIICDLACLWKIFVKKNYCFGNFFEPRSWLFNKLKTSDLSSCGLNKRKFCFSRDIALKFCLCVGLKTTFFVLCSGFWVSTATSDVLMSCLSRSVT